MSFYLLLILLVFCSFFQSFFSKLYSLRSDNASPAAPFVFSVIFGIFVGIASLVMNGFVFRPSALTFLFGLLNAAALVIYQTTQLNSLARGSYMISNICMLFGGILLPMIVSMLALGQWLSPLQIVGVVLMLICVILLNLQTGEVTKPKKGFWFFCIAMALANGTYSVLLSLQANLVGGDERAEMLTISYIGSAVFAFLVVLFMRREKTFSDFRMKRKPFLFTIGCCTATTLMSNLYLHLLSIGNTTVVTVFDYGGFLVLATIASFVVFGEKLSKLQIAGVIVGTASVIMLAI